jgi:hypothetical protein
MTPHRCPGGFAARGDPQATMVTALTCCYAPRGEGGNAK